MKIISTPDYTTWTYQFTCHFCQSKLCADHTDVQYRQNKQWYSDSRDDGGYHGDVDYYFLLCPVCSKESDLIPNQQGVNLPVLLQEKLKKNYGKKK